MKATEMTEYYHYFKDSRYAHTGHRHSEFEVNIVLKGEMRITCGESVFQCKQGQALIFWAGIFHCNRVVSAEDAELISLHYVSEEEQIIKPMLFSLKPSDLQLLALMEEELVPFTDDRPGVIYDAANCLLEALLIRLRSREEKRLIDDSQLSAVYHQAVKYMASAIGENPSVSAIARKCGVCDTLLKKAFAFYTGFGVKTYFTDMKIHQAKELLLAGERVDAIADKLGFASYSTFSQTFKRVCGVSPRKFKANSMQKQ